MSRLFVIADTHFGWEAACTRHTRDDGAPLRPFAHADEADAVMIERWNALVKPNDHVWHLGDVAVRRRGLALVKQLNGHKRLVRGNHDIWRTRDFLNAGFEEIHGCKVISPNTQQGIMGAVLTHIPIHPGSLPRWGLNVHGHTHANKVFNLFPSNGQPDWSVYDRRYVCVSVEQTNYAPVPLDELLRRHSK